MTTIEQARKYISAIPGAVDGQGGHAATFAVASVLTNGFQLSESDAMELMREYNQRCVGPWSERELAHKVKSAISTPHDKPSGHLLTSGSNRSSAPSPYRPMPAKAPPVATKAPQYTPQADAKIPDPIPDGTREFLRAVFLPGDGICICPAVVNKEGREIPSDSGTVLLREDWLRRLDIKEGDVNEIFKSSDKTGIYVRVNPMRVGGAKDADVTAWRYALVEFDSRPMAEQWSIYQQSNIPCAAVISSGGKSLHAWVKVDAQNPEEYRTRVEFLHERFKAYGIDEKNKNPSRFSRLPGCERGDSRQELVALNCGAENWFNWQTQIESDGLGEEKRISEMRKFNPANDPNCILGERWLCKGGSCILIGPSGVGKSSLSMQMAMTWALNKDFFGIRPKRALKSLFIQAENDFGDLSEMVIGVIAGMGYTESECAIIDDFVRTRSNSHSTGKEFTEIVERLFYIHRPDIIWVDPILAYIGGDISKQDVCSQFLRKWLNPIAKATGVCFIIAHHTNKPVAKDHKAKKKWGATDLSYEGAGSAELVNWTRAVMLLQQTNEGTFNLILAKRGTRAKAVDASSQNTIRVKLQHSTKGICWERAAEVEPEAETPKSAGAPRKEFDFPGFLNSIKGEELTITQLKKRACAFAEISETTFKNKVQSILEVQLSENIEKGTFTTFLKRDAEPTEPNNSDAW